VNVIVQTQLAQQIRNGDPADTRSATLGVGAEPAIVETSTDQSWADLCKTLKRPAMLLGDVDGPDSEQP